MLLPLTGAVLFWCLYLHPTVAGSGGHRVKGRCWLGSRSGHSAPQAKPSQRTEPTGLSLCPGAWEEPRGHTGAPDSHQGSVAPLAGRGQRPARGTAGVSPAPDSRGALSHQSCLRHVTGLGGTACGPPAAWGSQNGNRVCGDGTPALGSTAGEGKPPSGTAREPGGGRQSLQAPPRARHPDRDSCLPIPRSGPQQQRKMLGDADCGAQGAPGAQL